MILNVKLKVKEDTDDRNDKSLPDGYLQNKMETSVLKRKIAQRKYIEELVESYIDISSHN